MADKYPSTILPQTNDPQEIQKGNLDLLAKINEVASSVPTLPTSIADTSWHLVGAVGEPAFQNSWVWFGAGNSVPAFRKDGFGFVHLKGSVKNGTNGSVIFTLPAGYRPLEQIAVPSLYFVASTVYWVTINPDGTVVHKSGGGPNTGTWFDGITFLAEQ